MPGPESWTVSSATPSRRLRVTAKGTPSGVCGEDVVDKDVDDVADVGLVQWDAALVWLDVDAHRAFLVLCEHRPEGHSITDDASSVRRTSHGAAYRAFGVLDDGVDSPLQLIDVLLQASGECGVRNGLGVKTKSGHRGAQPVGQVSDGCAFGRRAVRRSVAPAG